MNKAEILKLAELTKTSLGLKEWIHKDGAYLRPNEVYGKLERRSAALMPLIEALAESNEKLAEALTDACKTLDRLGMMCAYDHEQALAEHKERMEKLK